MKLLFPKLFVTIFNLHYFITKKEKESRYQLGFGFTLTTRKRDEKQAIFIGALQQELDNREE
jgi:hypothetical protein